MNFQEFKSVKEKEWNDSLKQSRKIEEKKLTKEQLKERKKLNAAAQKEARLAEMIAQKQEEDDKKEALEREVFEKGSAENNSIATFKDRQNARKRSRSEMGERHGTRAKKDGGKARKAKMIKNTTRNLKR